MTTRLSAPMAGTVVASETEAEEAMGDAYSFDGLNLVGAPEFHTQKYGTVQDYDMTRGGLGDASVRQNTDADGNVIPQRTLGGYRPAYFDATDSLATQGYVVSFYHVPSGRTIQFKAFVETFNETYNCDWSSEAVYGRADPIYMFKQTTRQITLALKVPASTTSEAYENLTRVQRLVQMLYPSYTDASNASTISSSPLIRLSVLNLLREQKDYSSMDATYKPSDATSPMAAQRTITFKKTAKPGQLGVIKNLAVNHNIDNPDIGVIGPGNGVALPKMIEVNLTFDAIHEHNIGWENREYNTADGGTLKELGPIAPNFPYGVMTDQPPAAAVPEFTTMFASASAFNDNTLDNENERLDNLTDLAIKADQQKEHAANRYAGLFGGARARLDKARNFDDIDGTFETRLNALDESRSSFKAALNNYESISQNEDSSRSDIRQANRAAREAQRAYSRAESEIEDYYDTMYYGRMATEFLK